VTSTTTYKAKQSVFTLQGHTYKIHPTTLNAGGVSSSVAASGTEGAASLQTAAAGRVGLSQGVVAVVGLVVGGAALL